VVKYQGMGEGVKEVWCDKGGWLKKKKAVSKLSEDE
jgi:hypothetical protein